MLMALRGEVKLVFLDGFENLLGHFVINLNPVEIALKAIDDCLIYFIQKIEVVSLSV